MRVKLDREEQTGYFWYLQDDSSKEVFLPSPYPKYQPEFTQKDLDQARQLIRQHKAPHAQVVRAKMVLALAEEPEMSNDVLAKHVGVHYNTAWKWRKRWATCGFSLTDEPRSGRPSSFSP